MKYDEAMADLKAKKAVSDEHERMKNHAVFKAVSLSEVPKFAKILERSKADPCVYFENTV